MHPYAMAAVMRHPCTADTSFLVSFVYFREEDTSQVDPIELCSVLVTAMADKDIDDPDINGQSPLHRAAFRGATISCAILMQVFVHKTFFVVGSNQNNVIIFCFVKIHYMQRLYIFPLKGIRHRLRS